MLGLARASQYAGWWANQGVVTADMTLNFTVDTPQAALVSPRYYADFTGVDAAINNNFSADVGGAGTKNIDMTGVNNTPKKNICAYTIKVGTDWMTTAGTSGYFPGFTWFHGFNNNGTDTFFSAAASKFNGDYIFGQGASGARVVLTTSQMANYRNRWLGVIVCGSNSSSDFANWTGGSDTANTQYAQRALLIDIVDGTIIGQDDRWNNQTFNTVDLTQQWTFGYLAGTYYDNSFGYFDNDITLYYRDQIQVGSHWFAIGDMVDPVDYYTQLVGFGLPNTVNGIKAWFYWYADEAGTAQGTPTFGYTQDTPTDSRCPANTRITIRTAANDSPVPTFVQIN